MTLIGFNPLVHISMYISYLEGGKSQMKKKLLSLALAGMMSLSLLSGCGNGGTPSTSGEAPPASNQPAGDTPAGSADISDSVDFVIYLMGGPESVGMPDVVNEANKILKEKINATFSIQYIDWSDFQSTYASVLAAGVGADIMYSADWLSYFQHIEMGGFYEMPPEMLDAYAPRARTSIPEIGWKDVSFNGAVYMVPAEPTIAANNYMLLRGDIIQKYGLDTPTGLADIEPYFQAIKDNEPDIVPFNGNQDDVRQCTPFWLYIGHTFNGLLPGGGTGTYYYTDEPVLKNLGMLTDFEDALIKGAKMAKDWYDKGYVNPAALSAPSSASDNFVNGRSGIAFGNTISLEPYAIKAAAAGYEPLLIPTDSWNARGMAPSYAGNGFSITASCKEPERALMMIDMIMFDEEVSTLLYNGIEGVNYVLQDGKKSLPSGVTPDTNTYSGEAQGFWMVPNAARLLDAGLPEQYVAQVAFVQNNYNTFNPRAGFTAVTDEIATEVANLTALFNELIPPMQVGAVADADAAWDNFKQQMLAAGWQKVFDTVTEQVEAFNAGQ